MLDPAKLKPLIDRFEAVEHDMASRPDADTYVRLSKEHAELEPVARAARAYCAARSERDGLCALLDEPRGDEELRALARDELGQLHDRLEAMEGELRLLLLPQDADDRRGAILEVRAGTGGDEAALFAGDLVRMYLRYAELRKWTCEVMTANEGEVGGYREFIASISGPGVYQRLKFESGVHRVQRVPQTESGGRIHTSAATVAVLPEVEDVDITIDEKDLRVDVFRASGPGGQSVNTTDSAVRITHLPTGIVVSQQDEKSQHKNRAKAMKVLRARLYERERQLRDAERASERRGQIGTGDRSERIRTYNFPQGRVTDHRIQMTLHKLDQILEGGGLDELIDALTAQDQTRRLAAAEKVA